MGFRGAGQHVPLSGVTATARLFTISASKEKDEKENNAKIERLRFIFFYVVWGLRFQKQNKPFCRCLLLTVGVGRIRFGVWNKNTGSYSNTVNTPASK